MRRSCVLAQGASSTVRRRGRPWPERAWRGCSSPLASARRPSFRCRKAHPRHRRSYDVVLRRCRGGARCVHRGTSNVGFRTFARRAIRRRAHECVFARGRSHHGGGSVVVAGRPHHGGPAGFVGALQRARRGPTRSVAAGGCRTSLQFEAVPEQLAKARELHAAPFRIRAPRVDAHVARAWFAAARGALRAPSARARCRCRRLSRMVRTTTSADAGAGSGRAAFAVLSRASRRGEGSCAGRSLEA